MTRHRAADGFAAIRARMKELRRERERAEAAEIELRGDPSGGRGRANRWRPGEISRGSGRVGQSGSDARSGRHRAWWTPHE